MKLFENEEKIRTLGFYQPFGTLMLHGKIETRWVRQGKKPPFPLGKYVFYTTKKPCDYETLLNWCGVDMIPHLNQTLEGDPTRDLTEVVLGYGELTEIRLLTKEDEQMAFVKYQGTKLREIDGKFVKCVQWALIFENVKPVKPFDFELNGKSLGKQGVGFLPEQLRVNLSNF